MAELLRQLNYLFPFRRLLKFLLIFSVVVQALIITYNHLTGYYILENGFDFITRLFFGSLLSLIAAWIVAIPDLAIINYLNGRFQWNRRAGVRILLQVVLSVLTAFIVSVFITLLSNYLGPYETSLVSVLINNALILGVLNILLMAILEGWLFFTESNRSKLRAEKLQKELSQVRFEVLKSQINPHFMFNSLNVLSGLIEKDPVKAQLFIDEFSQIYRYVLETIEKQVVTVEEELNFVRSYTFLQQIRYGDSLHVSVDIPAELLNLLLPPLSLQTIMENSIKHNVISRANPLKVEISYDGDFLVVTNNIQPKISIGKSTGLGQKNLKKRYEMICSEAPVFTVQSEKYVVRLPLISN